MSENQQIISRRRPQHLLMNLSFALVAALLFALFAGIIINRIQNGSLMNGYNKAAISTYINSEELEEKYGLQVVLIGVTAGGGMVDFRFKILDVDKAKALLDNHANMPQLIPDGSKTRLGIPGSHSPNYANGKVYYMLFGNAGGIIKPGKLVEVAFGNVILEAIAAQ